jgi:hypothetical protein
MTHSFHCPDCGSEHCEPADATFVLAVRCSACDLLDRIDARARDRRNIGVRRAA